MSHIPVNYNVGPHSCKLTLSLEFRPSYLQGAPLSYGTISQPHCAESDEVPGHRHHLGLLPAGGRRTGHSQVDPDGASDANNPLGNPMTMPEMSRKS